MPPNDFETVVRQAQEFLNRQDCSISRETLSFMLAAAMRESSRQRLQMTCRDAVNRFGVQSQIDKTVEECAELIVAIKHNGRGRFGMLPVAKEVADVEIVCSSMREILGHELIDYIKNAKVRRLADRIAKGIDR